MAFAGHVLDPAEKTHSLLLEGKMDAQVAQGRPRHIWIDDNKDVDQSMDTYEVIKRIAQDRQTWRTYITSYHQRIAEDDDEDLQTKTVSLRQLATFFSLYSYVTDFTCCTWSGTNQF